jgi:microcystin-dependent protein
MRLLLFTCVIGLLCATGVALKGEVRLFAGTLNVPDNWELCDGRPTSNFVNPPATFSLRLPNLAQRVVIGAGEIAAPSQTGGTDMAEIPELPIHSHTLQATNGTATSNVPAPTTMLGNANIYRARDEALVEHENSTSTRGQGLPHNNMQPYVGLYFMINTNFKNEPRLGPGEVAMVTYQQEPPSWEFAWGRTLSISAYPELYRVIGNKYSNPYNYYDQYSDYTTFSLPDVRVCKV